MKKYISIIFALSVIFIAGCKSVANYPIDDPLAANADDRLIGKWKFREDTNKLNFYTIRKSETPYKYHAQFWNRSGTNPTYEGSVYFSKIDNSLFLNIPCWEEEEEKMTYFFLKILAVNADYSQLTTATVFDTTMSTLKSKAEVRERIMKNLDNPEFYSDTVHFYKIN